MDKTISVDEDTWNPDLHYGITRVRAIELEGTEIPRGSAALFHFDVLTLVEQQNVIHYEKEYLRQLIQQKQELAKESRLNAETSRSLRIKHTPIYQYKERINKLNEAIIRYKERILDLEGRLKSTSKGP